MSRLVMIIHALGMLALCAAAQPALAQASQPAASPGAHGAASWRSQHDPQAAIRAMQLTPAQTTAIQAVRHRYTGKVHGYVDRLNAMARAHAAPQTIKMTEDSLKMVVRAEHAATDSVITPAQRQAFDSAMRVLRLAHPTPTVDAPVPTTGRP